MQVILNLSLYALLTKKKKKTTPIIPVPSQWKQQSLPKNIVANLLSVSVPMVKFRFLILLSSKTTRY